MPVQSNTAQQESTRQVCDQMGRTVRVPVRPQRVVSLVPSQTELLVDLGLGEGLVGATRYCVHPSDLAERCTLIGGTKRFDFAAIQALQPDLVIGNKEENYAEGIARLEQSLPVWMSDIETFDHALDMIEQVGDLVAAATAANQLTRDIRRRWSSLSAESGLSAAYLIWKKPYMAVGAGTFIHDVLAKLGLHNVFANQQRYPEFTLTELQRLAPRLLLLSSEPFPFTQTHVEELSRALPATQVLLVDGEMFSWYGSRLQLAPDYFDVFLNQIRELN